MAKLTNGIFGGMTGTIGNLVSYTLNGQQILRGKAAPSNKPATVKQLHKRQQMTVLSSFFKGMSDFLKTGFAPRATGTPKNYYNLAVEYNMPHALKGDYPDIAIAYDHVILSKGTLPGVLNPAVTWVTEGLKFTWENLNGTHWPHAEDQVMLLAYNASKNKHFFIQNGAKRNRGWDILDIPASMQQEQFELYISFVSNDRSEVANSQYIGSIKS
ncbi:hypothetical protein AAKU52_002800 [Pedobacter sp. CG_S7]|uniref:DUF6266 family protein n=1 Tax=Pedobacter sp. CG_S7 TaxID=3143930 RepID=UPI003396F274